MRGCHTPARKRLLVGLLSCYLIADAQAAAPGVGGIEGVGASRPVARPRLAVIISVDGLSWATIERYRPWFTSGLKRLLDEGWVETAARYRHLNTETGPGHSSLSTGAPPRVHCVVANRWLEQNADGSIRSVYAAEQPAPTAVPGQPPFFYEEVPKDGRLYAFAFSRELERWRQAGEIGKAITRLGAGPQGETVVFDSDDAIVLFNQRHGRPFEAFPPQGTVPGPGTLRVDTIGDRLVAADPRSRVVVVSAKDRTSTLLAGRSRAHVVYWYDQESGRFVTSPAYDSFGLTGSMARAVVARINKDEAGGALLPRFGTRWDRLPADDRPTGLGAPSLPGPAPNLTNYQIPDNGLGFPHDLTFGEKGYFWGFYVSPFTDELVADLVLAFLEDERFALGRAQVPDLLGVGFSAQDVVSHSYGVESEENLDTLRRVDRQIGRVLDAVLKVVPRDEVVLALSSDHGFARIPEAAWARERRVKGGRLVNTDRTFPNFYERLNRLLEEELCLAPGSKPVFGGEGWMLIYNRPLLPFRTVEGRCGAADQPVTSAALDKALPEVLRRVFPDEIRQVFLASERERWSETDPATEFVRNDFDPERSGDALLIPREGVLMHWDPARGSHHGSIHEYDIHVPLVFWGGSVRAGRSDRDSTPYDLAPTLAARLGLTLPAATGRSRLP